MKFEKDKVKKERKKKIWNNEKELHKGRKARDERKERSKEEKTLEKQKGERNKINGSKD